MRRVIILISMNLIFNFSNAAELSKGVGPVKELKLESTIDQALSNKGKEVFTSKCSACHKMEERYVGPALKGITTRRAPEWTMNMILNPAEMLEKDETAQELLGEFLVPMTFQNVTQDETRAIYEYFRFVDSGGEKAASDTKKETKAKQKK